jgi:5-keto-L-gluconate epimerase
MRRRICRTSSDTCHGMSPVLLPRADCSSRRERNRVTMWKISMATSPARAKFAPLLYPGRLFDCIADASKLGYHGVEISLRAREEVDLPRLRRQIHDHGLHISAFATGRMFLEDGLSLTDPDVSVRHGAIERLKGHMELGAEFEAPVIIGMVRGTRPASDGDGTSITLLVESMGSCARYADQLGAKLLLEAINRYETTMINTADEAVHVVEQVGVPNVGILLDLFHMNIEEVSIGDAIRRTGSRLGYFHMVDSNRLAPGWGHIDYQDVLRALTAISYDKWVSCEVLPLPDSESAARQAVQFTKKLQGLQALSHRVPGSEAHSL